MTKDYDHVTIKIPKDLVQEIDKLIGKHGFRSRGEFAKEAIRKLLQQYQQETTQPEMEHFNLNENGVLILDRTLNKKGRIIQVYFNPKGILCEYCNSNNCRHVLFALSKPEIQEVIRKRRKEGWNLPDV